MIAWICAAHGADCPNVELVLALVSRHVQFSGTHDMTEVVDDWFVLWRRRDIPDGDTLLRAFYISTRARTSGERAISFMGMITMGQR